MADVDFGTTFSLLEDIDENLSLVTGPQGVVEAVMRRLQTPRGGLWYDRDYGTDVRQYLNSTTPRTAIAAAVEVEAEKDERVESASAEVTREGRTIRIVLRIETGAGPFSLTISVDQLTVELIDFSQAA